MNSELSALLSSITCGDLVRQQQQGNAGNSHLPKVPICLDVELTVQEGCSALAKHKISSAPIYSPEAGGFIGMLDYKDLVAYILEVFHKVPKDQAHFDADMEVSDIVKRANMDRQGVPIRLISNLSHRNPLVAVYADQPLTSAVEEFVKCRVHRVIVLERSPEGTAKFIGVLSQSAVASLVTEKFGRLRRANAKAAGETSVPTWSEGDRTLVELGLVKGRVHSVDPNDTVLDALYVMHERSVTSVAIVDSGTQKLVGSISMTDVKEILSTRGGWRHLYDPSFRFFAALRSQQGLEAPGGSDRVPSFTVHPSTPLMSALEKMAATHTHRVWILEENNMGGGDVVGVLSLSDVMPMLLRAAGGGVIGVAKP